MNIVRGRKGPPSVLTLSREFIRPSGQSSLATSFPRLFQPLYQAVSSFTQTPASTLRPESRPSLAILTYPLYLERFSAFVEVNFTIYYLELTRKHDYNQISPGFMISRWRVKRWFYSSWKLVFEYHGIAGSVSCKGGEHGPSILLGFCIKIRWAN